MDIVLYLRVASNHGFTRISSFAYKNNDLIVKGGGLCLLWHELFNIHVPFFSYRYKYPKHCVIYLFAEGIMPEMRVN